MRVQQEIRADYFSSQADYAQAQADKPKAKGSTSWTHKYAIMGKGPGMDDSQGWLRGTKIETHNEDGSFSVQCFNMKGELTESYGTTADGNSYVGTNPDENSKEDIGIPGTQSKNNNAQSGGGINWKQVGDGALTTTGGLVSTVVGIVGIATGVVAPAGVAAVILGVPTVGFGVGNIIKGFQGGKKPLPSGPLEATDIGFGGDGTLGQVGDVFSGGLPKDALNGVLMGYGIYSSNIGQILLSNPKNVSNMNIPYTMPRDNTYVAPRKIH